MTQSGWNLGAWGGLDVRSTEVDNSFWQLSGGLEALSVKWDARANFYVPTTDPQASPELAEVKLKGNNIFMIGGEEVALYGVDGELGYLLFGSPQTKPGTRHELRVYGGAFWFDHSDAIHEVAGPKARIEWRIDDVIANWAGSRLTLDAGYSNDEVRAVRGKRQSRVKNESPLTLPANRRAFPMRYRFATSARRRAGREALSHKVLGDSVPRDGSS